MLILEENKYIPQQRDLAKQIFHSLEKRVVLFEYEIFLFFFFSHYVNLSDIKLVTIDVKDERSHQNEMMIIVKRLNFSISIFDLLLVLVLVFRLHQFLSSIS